MANPDKPVIEFSYAYAPYGTQLDNDLANLAQANGDTIDALEDIRRSDGALKNGIVTADSLAADVGEKILTFVSGIRAYTGTADTLTLDDAGKIVESNCSSDNTCTVPPYSSVPFEVLTRIDLVQIGVGALTIAAGVGVTIHSRDGALKFAGRYAVASLYNRGQDEWVLVGALI